MPKNNAEPPVLNRFDTDLFLHLHHARTDWLDPVMVLATDRNTWLPAYAVLIGWLVWQYRPQSAGLLLTLAVAVLLTDQTASALLKPLVHRLRPCHEPALRGQIRALVGCGGQFGFVSSHAGNAFALATGLWWLLGARHGWLRWAFVWAAWLAWSRIYVGVHYPLDVLAGAAIGTAWATGCVWLYRRYWPGNAPIPNDQSRMTNPE
jgi:undecaprenyl-diphosphatase